jgi:AP2-associated kinase
MAAAYSSSLAPRSAAAPAPTAKQQPAGTFLPNTKVQVGSHRVVIEKYLSEGGFAHVYVVRIPRDNHKHELAVLKRVAVPDREHLASMRTEVETMKKLKGHKHVVLYMDSHASQLKGGGYEVFLLMEYCTGGGLIDFMNTRLQHRLTEPEILKIFGDVAEGVACMHYLKPPLLHRDLKVENVLITKSASSGNPIYKLCDFGSAAVPRPAAKTTEEGRLIEEDVQKHTTMQYRSPEMIDVWRKQPIDEKADIWALGVLLYKLCYYTTPFEDVGQMAILNASFKFPNYPSFSPRLKKFISWMLKEDPKQRPNIYQVVKEVCSMRGTEVPIKDIYADRTQSEARRTQELPNPSPPMSSPGIGLQKTAPQVQVQSIPDIAPMRRGRPTAPAQQAPTAAKPAPSPARGDPFAALDSKSYDVRAGAVDELSKRFPSLDEFTIAHDSGGKFPFSPNATANAPEASAKPLSQRVTNALADEVFGQTKPKADITKSQSTSQVQNASRPPVDKSRVMTKVREISQESPLVHQPTPVRPGMTYTSTGVGSSPPPTKPPRPSEISQKPIWRVPNHHRSASQPRASEAAQAAADSLKPSLPPSQRPGLLDLHRSKSQTATLTAGELRSPTSSRPSLEGHRPAHLEFDEPATSRAKSAQSRQRPSSVYVSSNLDYLRDQESSRKRPSMEARRHSRQASQSGLEKQPAAEDTPIEDDMDFLRNTEENDVARRKSQRKSGSHHRNRSSLPSIAGGAKQLFGGRFGDAFKRFEHSSGDEKEKEDAPEDQAPTTPQSHHHHHHMPHLHHSRHGYGEEDDRVLSPIQGSEATPTKYSDVESAIDETEDLPPDVRRELERQRLSQEEKRVAEAAAAYRAKINAQGTGGPGPAGPSKASTIQKRVQSLLDEGRQSPVPRKTAEGYGKYTDASPVGSDAGPPPVGRSNVPSVKAAPPLARRPAPAEISRNPYPQTRRQPNDPPAPSVPIPSSSAPPAQAQQSEPPLQRVVSRPSVPPKSQALRTGGRSAQWPPQQPQPMTEPARPLSSKGTGGLAALLAKDLEGVPDYPPTGSSATNAYAPDTGGPLKGDEDLEADFSKRYPSLAGIEMVETEIGSDDGKLGGQRMRVREV